MRGQRLPTVTQDRSEKDAGLFVLSERHLQARQLPLSTCERFGERRDMQRVRARFLRQRRSS